MATPSVFWLVTWLLVASIEARPGSSPLPTDPDIHGPDEVHINLSSEMRTDKILLPVLSDLITDGELNETSSSSSESDESSSSEASEITDTNFYPCDSMQTPSESIDSLNTPFEDREQDFELLSENFGHFEKESTDPLQLFNSSYESQDHSLLSQNNGHFLYHDEAKDYIDSKIYEKTENNFKVNSDDDDKDDQYTAMSHNPMASEDGSAPVLAEISPGLESASFIQNTETPSAVGSDDIIEIFLASGTSIANYMSKERSIPSVDTTGVTHNPFNALSTPVPFHDDSVVQIFPVDVTQLTFENDLVDHTSSPNIPQVQVPIHTVNSNHNLGVSPLQDGSVNIPLLTKQEEIYSIATVDDNQRHSTHISPLTISSFGNNPSQHTQLATTSLRQVNNLPSNVIANPTEMPVFEGGNPLQEAFGNDALTHINPGNFQSHTTITNHDSLHTIPENILIQSIPLSQESTLPFPETIQHHNVQGHHDSSNTIPDVHSHSFPQINGPLVTPENVQTLTTDLNIGESFQSIPENFQSQNILVNDDTIHTAPIVHKHIIQGQDTFTLNNVQPINVRMNHDTSNITLENVQSHNIPDSHEPKQFIPDHLKSQNIPEERFPSQQSPENVQSQNIPLKDDISLSITSPGNRETLQSISENTSEFASHSINDISRATVPLDYEPSPNFTVEHPPSQNIHAQSPSVSLGQASTHSFPRDITNSFEVTQQNIQDLHIISLSTHAPEKIDDSESISDHQINFLNTDGHMSSDNSQIADTVRENSLLSPVLSHNNPKQVTSSSASLDHNPFRSDLLDSASVQINAQELVTQQNEALHDFPVTHILQFETPENHDFSSHSPDVVTFESEKFSPTVTPSSVFAEYTSIDNDNVENLAFPDTQTIIHQEIPFLHQSPEHSPENIIHSTSTETMSQDLFHGLALSLEDEVTTLPTRNIYKETTEGSPPVSFLPQVPHSSLEQTNSFQIHTDPNQDASLHHQTPTPGFPVITSPSPVKTQTVDHIDQYRDKNENGDGKPAQYFFTYDAEDTHTGLSFGHQESRQGHRTEGSYYVPLPDGRVMKVSYYVEPNSGFVAETTYEGEAKEKHEGR